MKTKKKSFVALIATLAIGTASVAGLALGANANHGFVAKADTSITAVADSDIKLGTNSVTLYAGEEKTFVLDITNVGTYGFKWLSGAAVFKFEDISVVADPDDPIYDPDDPLTGVSDPYENVPLGLNEELDYFYVKIATPDTAKVTIIAEEDTEIKFEVSHRIDTGINVFNSGSYKVNDIPAGKYQLEWKKGNGVLKIGDETYTLNADNKTQDIELSSPATTEVEVVSNSDEALEFTLSYNETVDKIIVGENSLSGDSYVIIDSISAGYYTFTLTSGSATFAIANNTFDLNDDNAKFTVYIGSPNTTVISVTDITAVSFTLSYSETDPDASSSTLKVGTQLVNATGFGEYYTFTASRGQAGTYTLNCYDDNAFIMVVTEYGEEQILWAWNDKTFEMEYKEYSFTLAAGQSITFLMATNDWNDASYNVIIAKAQ